MSKLALLQNGYNENPELYETAEEMASTSGLPLRHGSSCALTRAASALLGARLGDALRIEWDDLIRGSSHVVVRQYDDVAEEDGLAVVLYSREYSTLFPHEVEVSVIRG